MEINFIEKFKKVDQKILFIYSSVERFNNWHKQYIQSQSRDNQAIIDTLYYTQSYKEIVAEQKQFLSSYHGQQIKILKFQFNNAKLITADEANIRFLFQSLTKLDCISFSSISSQVNSQILNILMESGHSHLHNIRSLKFQNGFFAITNYSKFIRSLANLNELELSIPNNEDPEQNIITELHNLQQLKSFSVSFGHKVDYHPVNSNNLQIQQLQENGNANKTIVDIILNQIIDMSNLTQLTLNISGKISTADQFNLLNNSLSHKHLLQHLSLDLSYHTQSYNIAHILQLNQHLKKITLNCTSSYKFTFEQLNYSQTKSKQISKRQNSQQASSSDKDGNIDSQNGHPVTSLDKHSLEENNLIQQCSCLLEQSQEQLPFQYTQLETLHLKLNFTKSSFANSVFNFLLSQTSLMKTLKNLRLELSFIYPSLCVQSVGHFLSRLEQLEKLHFQCHSEIVDNTKDNIYLLRQIVKLKNLKNLTFNMKVRQNQSDYCQLMQQLTQQCQKIDINISNNLGLIKIGKQNLAIYTILNEFPLYVADETKQYPDVLNYVLNCFVNNKSLEQIFLQFTIIPNQTQQEVSTFIEALDNFKMLEVLNMTFSKFKIPEIKYMLKQLCLVVPRLKLLKVLQIQNRNFQQSNFKEEYQSLLTTSISSNLFLKNINLENYSNQMYDDYQLLYLQNLLNFKYKIANSLFPQIRVIKNKWPSGLRKQIILDLVKSNFI